MPMTDDEAQRGLEYLLTGDKPADARDALLHALQAINALLHPKSD